jgi:hypothetical protein
MSNKVGTFSTSFDIHKSEADNWETILSELSVVAKSLDIPLMVFHITDPKCNFNTKLCFKNERDSNFLTHVWGELQAGYTADDMIDAYFSELQDRFYP